jgi:hypothetical protein
MSNFDEKLVNIYSNSISSINDSTLDELAELIKEINAGGGDRFMEVYENEEFMEILRLVVEPEYKYDDEELYNHFANLDTIPADFIKRLIEAWDNRDNLFLVIDFVNEHGY